MEWSGRCSPHLLLEVADGECISIGEKMEHPMTDAVVLQVVHQMRPIALHERMSV